MSRANTVALVWRLPLSWVLVLAFALALVACIGDPPEARLTEAQARALQRQVVASPPAAMITHDAIFSDKVALLGYLLEPRSLSHEAGSKLKITLVWQVRSPLATGFRLFTHLTDLRGAVLGNLDDRGPLRALEGVAGVPFAPSRWPAGKLVLDPLSVTLPESAPEQIAIAVGFYRGQQRIAVSGGGADARRSAALIKLRVKGADPRRVPELAVPRLSDGVVITIDGELREAAWRRAATTGPFVNPASGRPDPRLPVGGSAKLLYDNAFLYVAFEVRDADVRGGFPPDAVDAHLWTRDTVEMMIDPDGDGDGRDYYELQISPQNLVFDSRFDRYNQPRGGPDGPFGHQRWSAHADSAVRIAGSIDDDRDRDQGYTVEAKVPWASFGKARRAPPQPGDRWRINLYAMQNNGGVAWSPILGQGNFHRASRFGRVTWTAEQAP